jgi:TonB family protein
MNIANLRQRVICSFVLMFACNIPIHAQLQPPQSNQESGPTQDKTADQKMPGASAKGNIEILSDTQGVDFRPYLMRFKSDVQGKWYSLIPAIARPPISKSGTAVIEFAIAKNGKVYGMKLVQSSGDSELDKAAWGGITDTIPLSTLPSEFNGDYLRLRCSFIYNPAAASAMLKTSNKQKPSA